MKTILALGGILALLFAAAPAEAQPLLGPVERRQPSPLSTGAHDNFSETTRLAYATVLNATNVNSLRVRFAKWSLGEGSFVKLTSIHDGAVQTLDRQGMIGWNGESAWFNGGTVRLELHVAPGDFGIAAEVAELITSCACDDPLASRGFVPATLCGADNRSASSDNRVGRIGGCTAWLLSNGATLTAGHCAPSTAPFEVNIPASLADGTTVRSAPQDQFPVDPNGWTWINNGTGDDWAVFRLRPNANTGRRAHEQHGFFRPSRELPILLSTMRVTGCGTDTTPAGSTGNGNAQNQTLQTATGQFQGEFGSGNDIELHYNVDTEGGNSGSPVIVNGNGFAIGIHTAGGCTAFPGTFNVGTSFQHGLLGATLENFPGNNTRYVDLVSPTGTQSGSVFQPFRKVVDAANNVPAGGIVSIVAGTYGRADGNTFTITKPMQIIAPVGEVRIGF